MSDKIRIIPAPTKTTYSVIVWLGTADGKPQTHELQLTRAEYYELLGYYPEEC